MSVASYLSQNSYSIIVPAPIVLEAATALAKDKSLLRPDLAKRLLENYGEIYFQTAGPCPARGSKRPTPFDYLVLATARFYHITIVFSFDTFYRKNGLTLAEELVQLGTLREAWENAKIA